ncbi:MAG TPA: hypothetical protein PLK55_00135 [archaeon]|nr:hypothetical protein [archaeon]
MKGFVTLEYVLLIAGIISVLGASIIGIINLYNRNITANDNYRLKGFCKDLKAEIELFEIMPEGKIEIEPGALSAWQIEKSNNKITLKNNQKTCEIRTTLSINCTITEITETQKITLTKQNNILNID